MNRTFPQNPGQITLNDDYKWVLDGVEIEPRKDLELLIGEHWILGFVFRASDGQLIWSCWKEFVHVHLGFLMRARWPETGR